jgi:hypothetical protein
MRILLAGLFFLTGLCAQARTLEGVTLPDSMQVRGTPMTIVGMGVREISILGIVVNVYVGGLYLQHKDFNGKDISHNGDDVIHSEGLKVVKMQFKHHVSPSQMRDNWEKDVLNNCGDKDKCKLMKDNIARLKSFLPSVSSDDTMEYIFDDKGVEIQLKDANIGMIEDKAFADVMLASFIGAHPATEGLKKGLLAL